MCEMKNIPDGINGRLEIAKEKIKEHEGIVVEPIQTEQRKKIPKNSCGINFKLPNTWTIRVPTMRLGRGWKKYLKK